MTLAEVLKKVNAPEGLLIECRMQYYMNCRAVAAWLGSCYYKHGQLEVITGLPTNLNAEIQRYKMHTNEEGGYLAVWELPTEFQKYEGDEWE